METRGILHSKSAVIVEEVDIYQLPISRLDDGINQDDVELSIGDLHANAIKFLFFLLREGVLEINTNLSVYDSKMKAQLKGKSSEEIYAKLVEIYRKDPDISNHTLSQSSAVNPDIQKEFYTNVQQLEDEDLKFFKAIISNAMVRSKPKKIRLIGDELCDRGKNDLFILYILKKLKDAQINYHILESNHGAEFKNSYRRGFNKFAKKQEQNMCDFPYFNSRYFYPTTISSNDQSASMQNLGSLIDRKLVTAKEVNRLVAECYLPALKLIDYNLDENGDLKIFTHAPVGFETISGLASALNIEYKDETQKDLRNTIDEINKKFYKELNSGINFEEFLNTGARLDKEKKYRKHVYKGTSTSVNLEDLACYYYRLIWNRDKKSIQLNNGIYPVNWVHGHDSKNVLANMVCLDNNLGKDWSIWQFLWDVKKGALRENFSIKALLEENEKMGRAPYTILRENSLLKQEEVNTASYYKKKPGLFSLLHLPHSKKNIINNNNNNANDDDYSDSRFSFKKGKDESDS